MRNGQLDRAPHGSIDPAMRRLIDPPAFRLAMYVLVAATVAIALIPTTPTPPPFPHIDKIQHFAIFTMLAVLARLGFPDAPARLILERLAFLGAGIEVLQTIPLIERSSDVVDWLADLAGVAVGLGLALPIAHLLRLVRGRLQG